LQPYKPFKDKIGERRENGLKRKETQKKMSQKSGYFRSPLYELFIQWL